MGPAAAHGCRQGLPVLVYNMLSVALPVNDPLVVTPIQGKYHLIPGMLNVCYSYKYVPNAVLQQ